MRYKRLLVKVTVAENNINLEFDAGYPGEPADASNHIVEQFVHVTVYPPNFDKLRKELRIEALFKAPMIYRPS
jgi:hypothetical protein